MTTTPWLRFYTRALNQQVTLLRKYLSTVSMALTPETDPRRAAKKRWREKRKQNPVWAELDRQYQRRWHRNNKRRRYHKP